MPLFKPGCFISAAGLTLPWKIECDDLTEDDWWCIATIVGPHLKFGEIEGIPQGGLPFARALKSYKTEGRLLIVDDVLTTGLSMERQRGHRTAQGVVLFARGNCPLWVRPIWAYSAWLR